MSILRNVPQSEYMAFCYIATFLAVVALLLDLDALNIYIFIYGMELSLAIIPELIFGFLLPMVFRPRYAIAIFILLVLIIYAEMTIQIGGYYIGTWLIRGFMFK